MERAQGLIGIALLLGIGLLLSSSRRRVPWKLVGGGVVLQFALAGLLLALPPIVTAFEWVAGGINRVIGSADDGIRFVFGSLGDASGPWGFVFAFRVLPVIVFFASLMAVLYHLRVMQAVIGVLAWMLRRGLGVTGVEALAMAANVFVGQTEAPLCVKPYIAGMTRAQLMTLMTGGFATIAGSVLFAYVGMLGGDDEAARVEFIKHLLTASLLSAPAAFVMARVMVPETESPGNEESVLRSVAPPADEPPTRNVLDAAAAGASDGLRLALNVAAMLIAFVALLAVVDLPLAALGEWGPVRAWLDARGVGDLGLQVILGWMLAPVAWALGVPWAEASVVGGLLGQKLIVTEFLAYASLRELIAAGPGAISHRSAVLATYALCGFANFPSIAIQIGGLSALAPERRSDLASLGIRAMVAGACASWMTACVAGVVLPMENA